MPTVCQFGLKVCVLCFKAVSFPFAATVQPIHQIIVSQIIFK